MAEQQQQEQPSKKWEGETRVHIKGCTPAQVWPLISDFSSLHRWFPHVATCHLVEGVPGQPGVIRYCASTDGSQWAREQLVDVDGSEMRFSYEIVDNNAGFESYFSTVRLVEEAGMDGEDGSGCGIVWSFVADPVEGMTLEGLLGFFDFTAKAMAQRLQEALHGDQGEGEDDHARPEASQIRMGQVESSGQAEVGQIGVSQVRSAQVEVNTE